MGAISSDVGVSKEELMEVKKYQFYVKMGDQSPFIFQSSPILLDKPNNPFYVSEEYAVENIDKYMIKKYYRAIKGRNSNLDQSCTTDVINQSNDHKNNQMVNIEIDSSDF